MLDSARQTFEWDILGQTQQINPSIVASSTFLKIDISICNLITHVLTVNRYKSFNLYYGFFKPLIISHALQVSFLWPCAYKTPLISILPLHQQYYYKLLLLSLSISLSKLAFVS
jgi:hypothetical protein